MAYRVTSARLPGAVWRWPEMGPAVVMGSPAFHLHTANAWRPAAAPAPDRHPILVHHYTALSRMGTSPRCLGCGSMVS